MSKFDLIFEDAMFALRERRDLETQDPTAFVTKITELAKAIKSFLPKKSTEEETIESAVQQTLESNNIMALDSSVTKQFTLILSQPKGEGSFEVKIQGKDVPEQPNKTREIVITDTQWNENIYKEVYDKLNFLTTSFPEDSVNKLPPEEGSSPQPGAEQSALPGVEEQPAPLKV